MKYLKLILTVLLLLAVAVPVLVACDIGDKPDENTTDAESDAPGTESSGDNKLPDVVTGEILTDQTEFTLTTGDSVLRLTIRDNELYTTELSTKASGINHANADSLPYALPSQYQLSEGGKRRFDWQYVGYMNLRYPDNKYDKYGYLFRFRDEKINVEYDVYVTAHFRFNGPFEFTAYLNNQTGEDIEYIPAAYFRTSTLGEVTPTAWTFEKESGIAEGYAIYSGAYYPGTGIYKTKVFGSVSAAVNTNQNFNSGGQLPMMYIDYDQAYGAYYGMEWSNGTITATEGEAVGTCTVSAHLGHDGFQTTVENGTSFYMPTIYLGVYDGDVEVGSNTFKRWYLYNKAPAALLENENEPLVQQDMQIGLDAALYGIEAIKWDYGWWSDQLAPGQTQWRTNEGLLEVHNSAYLGVIKSVGASNLAEFVQKVKEKGLSLTTYILTKDTQITGRSDVPTSVGEYGHPEWFSDLNITGSGCSADFGNVDCVEFFKTYMLNFFKETGVTTWRSDFEPICRSSNKANRHDANGNDVQYWCTIGFRDLVTYLYDNLDDFRYESCSSGGSMKDLFTATVAVVINCDDSADFQSLKMSFYDSSYVIHPAQLQLPTNANTYTAGSAQYTGFGDHDYGLRSQMVGAVMLSNWSGTQVADKQSWQRHLSIYKNRIRPLIKYGDLYHVLPRPDGVNWDGFFYVNTEAKSSTKGCLMIFKPSSQAGDSQTVKLRGLEADVKYTVSFQDHTEQNCSMTGAQLMNEGLTVTFTGDCESDWVFIVETNN